MKRIIYLCIVCVFMLLQSGYAQDENIPAKKYSQEALTSLKYCQEESLGLKYYCDQDWQMQSVDDAVLVIISSEPDVTLIIAKIDSRVKFLSQLTNTFLQEKDRYADGFRTERIKLAKGEALKVKAYSKNNPEKRLLDYYFIKDKSLYSILFSVNPKENTDDYKFLFKKIVDGIEFTS